MNVAMLKCLVELSGGINAETADAADTEKFFVKFPMSSKTQSDLSTLEALGYISTLYADDEIYAIGVNMKARKYFK